MRNIIPGLILEAAVWATIRSTYAGISPYAPFRLYGVRSVTNYRRFSAVLRFSQFSAVHKVLITVKVMQVYDKI